jgi:flavin reductase (DIM6/NTAB) family NADH-FMN oxidoreductase RutF
MTAAGPPSLLARRRRERPETMSMAADPSGPFDVFRILDRELWLLTVSSGPRRGGLIATFVSQASLVPELPRILIGLANQHHSRALVEEAGGFALHLLGDEHLDWVWRFGLQSGRDADKLAGLSSRIGTSGQPILTDALAWLECRVESRMATGDRTVYLAEVLDGALSRPGPFLTLHRMLDLAPGDRRDQLRLQMSRDIAIDAAAIRSWRSAPRED